MIGEIESGVEETRMAQREYDSFAIGVLNDGDAVAPLDLSINVWADVGHTSEIDFGIQIPHRDDISGFLFSFRSKLKRTMLLTFLLRLVITNLIKSCLIGTAKQHVALIEQ